MTMTMMKLSIVSIALLVSQTVAFAPRQNNNVHQTTSSLLKAGLEVEGEPKAYDPFEDYMPGSSSEVAIKELAMGSGDAATDGDAIFITYSGYIMSNGQKLTSANEYGFELGSGNVMPGLDVAMKGKRVGSKYIVKIPPSFAYGEKGRGASDETGRGAIPPNSDLQFEVEVTKIVPEGPMAKLAIFGEGRAAGMAVCVALLAFSPLLG